MRPCVLVVPLFAVLAACGSAPESATSKDPSDRTGTAAVKTTPDRPEAATCGATALGLCQAVAREPWNPPPGCSPRGHGKAILRSDAELTPRLECTAGMNQLVDWTQHALLAVGYTLSPAGAGLGAFDDGKVITLVSRQRNPCPGGPMPMPMNTTAWFRLPAGGERSFADRVCTVESDCE